MKFRSTLAAGAAILALGAGITACGSSSSSTSTSGNASGSGKASTTTNANANAVNPNAPDVTPPGDIPDTQVYLAYSPPGGGYSVKVPEGWSRTSAGGAIVFTSKLNSIQLQSSPASKATTVASAKQSLVPQLSHSVNGFSTPKVSTVSRKAGKAVLITYFAWGKPNPVTGKKPPEAVERYIFFHKGKEVTLTLSGEKNADNVDPWRIVTNSLRYTK
ncbi:MAG: hypothetical protein M3R23_05920 [Actinomycetota bacterium]|nr:hypothetical protein [Actinomycetota bacterium]